MNQLKQITEAILFLSPKPVERKGLKRFVEKLIQEHESKSSTVEGKSDEPLASKQISQGANESTGGIEKPEDIDGMLDSILVELQREYQGRGIHILLHDGKVQMVSSPEVTEGVKAFFHQDEDEELSSASREVLAILGYNGPMMRAQIDTLRGVNSSYILRQLLIRGLIDRQLHPRRPQTYLYSISIEFLKYLGLQRIEDLPQYVELHSAFVSANQEDARHSTS